MKKSHIHLKSPGIMAINVTSDICQINQQSMYGCSVANSRIKKCILPTQAFLLDHFVFLVILVWFFI
jgi:hypothetical protein